MKMMKRVDMQYKTDVQCLAGEYGELREIAIEQGFPS